MYWMKLSELKILIVTQHSERAGLKIVQKLQIIRRLIAHNTIQKARYKIYGFIELFVKS